MAADTGKPLLRAVDSTVYCHAEMRVHEIALTVCGLPLAKSTIVIKPLRGPVVVGVKVTVIVQLERANECPQVFLTPKSPEAVMLYLATLRAGLVYLPNSVVWAIAYMLGPGFAFGIGTAVSPSGQAVTS